ncbi:3-isopropylmalate dehydratase small subunit [soil metagenome]
MRPFRVHRGVVAPLPMANVDTDQIIPARYLHRPREEGFGDVLFADLRRDESGAPQSLFILENPAYGGASIIVAGDNFGCGSSREHAVWALVDAGFRVVLAPSFGDIFSTNALMNGLLVIVLPPEDISGLMMRAEAESSFAIEVDLPAQRVRAEKLELWFEISAHSKQALLEGLSETAMTLRLESEIALFEANHAQHSAWLQRLPGE